ncbi:MAG TPA: prephenate dehydrogenase/arogenate dehydrogenase family protein [Acidimicrobiales bacterium]|jgi:prephenate dehydrogenase|nr:prephenate dehydrogenase/arogenate dehydrogenase family protein [Acidimicrobiales bacterium]
MTSPPDARRAVVVGTGLIGGSLGLALRGRGWHVTGRDLDSGRAERAVALGALDAVGHDSAAEITFVCTPVSSIAAEVRAALAGGGVVTDVGGVKAPVVAAVDHRCYVGGHPMAGSEQEGVDGADAELFEGATWVLTPTVDTDPRAYALVQSVITSLGADVVALSPQRHDELVATVSHVPHLTAATLMALAADGADEHAAVLRLAAGGFRDMTRIASGHPGIWPDICAENRDAIVDGLDRLVGSLSAMRDLVQRGDRGGLLATLERARAARVHLPAPAPEPEHLVEIRVPVPDRPGVLAEVTTLLGELGINIEDLEIAHSAEGPRGVIVLVVEDTAADDARKALVAQGFHPSLRRLS